MNYLVPFSIYLRYKPSSSGPKIILAEHKESVNRVVPQLLPEDRWREREY